MGDKQALHQHHDRTASLNSPSTSALNQSRQTVSTPDLCGSTLILWSVGITDVTSESKQLWLQLSPPSPDPARQRPGAQPPQQPPGAPGAEAAA